MLGDRDRVIAEAMEAINGVMTIHGLDEVKAGSPAFNKLCGHIDRAIANQAPKRDVGRPKQPKQRATKAI